MDKTRYRFRVGRLDGVLPDGSNWNRHVHLGDYYSKLTEYRNGVLTDLGWGLPYSPVDYIPELSVTSVEQTWDELHPRSRSYKTTAFTSYGQESFYNAGGPLLNVKIDLGVPASGVMNSGTYYSVDGTKKYEGGFMPPNSDFWGSGWASSPLSYTGASNALLPDVSSYFDRAWSMAKPKLEYANLYTFLREIGDVVPMLETSAKAFALQYQSTPLEVFRDTEFGRVKTNIGARLSTRRMEPKDLAEHFINHNFGWAPFLGDIGDFASTYVDADRIIRKISEENGKWIRKKVKVQKDDRSEVVLDHVEPFNSISYTIPCFPYGFPADFFLSPPSWTITENEKFSISASGKFRFYRPDFDMTLPDYSSAWNKVLRAMKIFGAEVNPYHIWQATPWSWLADWVSNLGAHIQRLQDSVEDQVAAAYFFITAHKVIEREMTVRLPFASGLVQLVFRRSFASKQRVSADSPYGFRLSWDNLSPKRLAILASLGITRQGARHG